MTSGSKPSYHGLGRKRLVRMIQQNPVDAEEADLQEDRGPAGLSQRKNIVLMNNEI